MFFPKAMSEIELIVPAGDLVNVTRTLGGRGVFHQVEAGGIGGDREHQQQDGWSESAAAYAALERRVQALGQNLGVESTAVQPGGGGELVDVDRARRLIEVIEREVRTVSDRLSEISRSLDTLRAHKRQLEAVVDVDLDIRTVQESRYLLSMLGTMPAANVGRLQSSLARVPHVFLTMREDSHRPVVWIGGTTGNRDVFERATRSAYFEALALPSGYEGSPREVIQWIDAEMARGERQLEDHRAALRALAAKHTGSLSQLAWDTHASRALAEAILKFGRLRHTYVIVGWVPTEALEGLLARIRQISKDTIVEASGVTRSGDRRNVPVALQSSRLLMPFQMLVTTYARPKYGEVDPTWLIALTFPLLFGAMFGDVGHGLMLAALGVLLMSRKVKRLRGLAGLGGLITVCGTAAVVFGFLYGSIFGFEHVLHAAWLQPAEDPLPILMFAIGAGVVLLSIGFLIGIFNAFVSRDWAHLAFGHGGIAAALLYWSLLGLFGSMAGLLPAPWQLFAVIAAVTGLMIMFSAVLIRLVERERPLIEGGAGTYAIQAPMELFETVISFLSNSLSYVRVGAFAIAHGVLSSVVFLLAEMLSPGHGIGYWIIVSLGNIVIVLYEGLIVGIQAMRLSYYEFFSKFFAGGGMRFEPLSLLRRQDA
jgi:V/A-type H+/Na+-transporting ATPase subunit I